VLVDRVQVIEEQVRATLKPFFKSGMIDKEAYKEIMRKAVPKVFSIVCVPGFSVASELIVQYILVNFAL